MVDTPKLITDFKNIKHVNRSMDFNFTYLLTVEVMLSSMFFMEEVYFVFTDCLTTSMLKVTPNMLPKEIEFKPP